MAARALETRAGNRHLEKESAPTHELRHWFGWHDGDFGEFRKRYRNELKAKEEQAGALRKEIARRKATLL